MTNFEKFLEEIKKHSEVRQGASESLVLAKIGTPVEIVYSSHHINNLSFDGQDYAKNEIIESYLKIIKFAELKIAEIKNESDE